GTVPWLGALREEARTMFAGSGLPTRRFESWKYSDLSRALAREPEGTSPPRPAPVLPGSFRAVFQNGVLMEAESNLSEAGALPLRKVLADPGTPFAKEIGHVNPQNNHALLNLNTALMEDGLVLHLPKNASLAAPLYVVFNWEGAEARMAEGRHLRILVLLEEGAEAAIVEAHCGDPGFSTVVSEYRLAAGAKLTHVRIEHLGGGARQSAATLGTLASRASYKGFYLSEGAKFSRHEALLELAEDAAQAEIDGVYLVSDSGHCDNTTVITHVGQDTASRQAFRGVLAGESRGVYQGCVRVRPDAQRTDARQMSRAMLLSRQAEIAIKPELEILADDVKCSHGATAGELDPAALFYLRARGIPEAAARALLVEAFLGELIEGIENETIRELAAAAVSNWLSVHAGEVSYDG
ncbi:MAG: Fe-S cluster assembly protein SufD, partial [Beijerinckiaceae bacterium]|nr:Fe-S cluster assembly protein SufD [Beijerinckiaceae bacterium]